MANVKTNITDRLRELHGSYTIRAEWPRGVCNDAIAIIKELLRGLEAACSSLEPSNWYPGSREDWEENQRDTRDWIIDILKRHGDDDA